MSGQTLSQPVTRGTVAGSVILSSYLPPTILDSHPSEIPVFYQTRSLSKCVVCWYSHVTTFVTVTVTSTVFRSVFRNALLSHHDYFLRPQR